MQLGILLAVLATIMISEHAPAEPVGSASTRLLLTLGTNSLVVLFATCGSVAISRAMRHDLQHQQTWLRWFGRLQQSHLMLWLAAIAVVIYGLHWPQLVRYNWGLDRAILIRDTVILAPIWIPLLFSWAAFYEVENVARRSRQVLSLALDRKHDAPAPRARFVWIRARHYLGLCLLPVLVLLAFQDLVTWVAPTWQESSFGWLLYLLPLTAVTLAFPLLLSRIWHTSRLPASPLRTQLEQLTRRVGVRTRDFKIWQTDRQLLNAAVSGLLPAVRYVFLTDALLTQLCDEEVASVVSHELGHIRRRHIWYRMLLLALPIWILGNLQAFSPDLSDQCSQWFASAFGNQFVVNSMIIPALTVIYAVVALGRYSRLLEHDADLSVYDDGQTEVFCSTIDRLSYLSHDRRERRTWLHPSTVSRIHLLQRAILDPTVAAQFRRRVNRFNFALLATWILTPVLLWVF